MELKAAYRDFVIGVFETSFFREVNSAISSGDLFFLPFLSVQYAMFIYRFFKEWRKSPRWSFSCCLALLLPLNDLQQEVLGMAGKNVLKQQLKTGNVDMPSLSGALKESGAVSIELTILPDHPEEPSGSPSEETEIGRKKQGNTDKGTVGTGDEPKKQAMTRKKKVKQQLQIGNVNMSSDSGPSKRSGAGRIVHASIHERPKKTRGSLTEEKKAVEEEEKVAGKVAFDKGEELEKKRLPQDNLQQEIRQMRSKNPLAQQLQTDNVNNPPASGALKKKGAVDFVLVTIHEQPKEACGSPPEERGTGEMKEGADNQVATNTPEEELEETHL